MKYKSSWKFLSTFKSQSLQMSQSAKSHLISVNCNIRNTNENSSISRTSGQEDCTRDAQSVSVKKGAYKSQVLLIEHRLRELFGNLDSDYITALAPGWADSPPSRAFYLMRLLFTCFLLAEILYQLVADWRISKRSHLRSSHDCALNLTCMLMVQTFALTGIWAPNFSTLTIFFLIRLTMAVDMLKRDDLYLLTHTSATIYAAVYIAMCCNSTHSNEYEWLLSIFALPLLSFRLVSQLLNFLSPIPTPTSDNYKPFSRLGYNLVRSTLAFLLLSSAVFDIGQQILHWNGKVGFVVEHAVYNLWLFYGLYCSYFGIFYQIFLFVWLVVCCQGNYLFSSTTKGLLTTCFTFFMILQAYMIWKIAGKPFFIKSEDV